MASSKKASSQVVQKPILSDNEQAAVAAKPATKTPAKRVIKKSRRRTSLDEFAVVNNLRPEIKAGFKAWLRGNLHHFDEEWNELYEEYQNRTL